MDFFEREEHARRNTRVLVVYFAAGVTMLIVVIYLAVLLIFSGVGRSHHRYYSDYGEQSQISLWDPKLFSGVAVCTLAIIAIGSGFKTLELSRGGSTVASMLGGRPVSPTTTDPNERKLLNVVEEMAIASGVPAPQVYILPEERAINAFAAGHTTSDAVVAVTEGSVKLLTRDELQGVIGHEFSHILNGDMRLNLRLMGAIFGIVCLAVIGRVLLQTRVRSGRDRNPLPLLGLVLLMVGWIGVLFGRLIQAAVSRQREFLADASSVQFTRNPSGLSGALQKIGAYSFGSRLEAAQAEQVSHMFFGNGVSEPFFGLLATHPPVANRIHAIDPAWDGKFPTLAKEQFDVVERAAISDLEHAKTTPPLLNAILGAAVLSAGGATKPGVKPEFVLPNLGTPTTAHLQYAADLRDSIPPAVQTAARDPLGASSLIYALLLSNDEIVRRKQLDELTAATAAAVCQETLRILPEVQSVAARAKLPLVNLALPGLRHLSATQYQQFRAAIEKLVESNGEVDLFEYVLQKIVLRHLDPQFNNARKSVIQYYALKPLLPDCAVLLSALAYVGQDEPGKVESAFQRGAQPLSYATQVPLSLLTAGQCGLEQVDAALNRLVQAAPQIKKNVLNACAQAVVAEGVIHEMEAELLRAIADTLDCPLPPFIPEL